MLLGQVLQSLGLVTKPQLDRCLEIQDRLCIYKPLGEILIEQRIIDAKTLSSILNLQKRKLYQTNPTREVNAPELRSRLAGAPISEHLKVSRELGASDLHLSSGRRPSLRIHGALIDLPVEPLSLETCKELVFSLLSEAQVSSYYERKSVDFNVDVPPAGRFRANAFRHYGGLSAVFRTISEQVRPFDSLGLPSLLKDLVRQRQGLLLITGPAGCGKTTTLASLIDMLNQRERVHIVTLEDPVEVVFKSEKALITQRQVYTHSHSYTAALSAALREDPDVIVIGDLCDRETVSTALTAAETGHLVIGTLHTRNAYATILRIIDQFPAQKRSHVRSILASALRAVLSQELVPNIDGRGRSLAYELMIVNVAVANLIRENRLLQIPMVMQMGGSKGMRLMDDSLKALVERKVISLEEAIVRVSDRASFIPQLPE